ncbi:DnaJ domain-containing protein [Leptolyngbya sp. FACHB-541]|uniref:J domain-containing protein n=1 Tax=Leptolyngbya sp. FACHB-541 TaxID=2692810 RepID=UPI0016828E7F|nr:J domain-containing protein [Leptolyngbya sp. FACHB-541]MBD2001341.1 DnaJ domain-containing protein [Leptolyngbya sp. FACHB-541]
MNLADCYRLLGLRTGASCDEIKASYRRLARQYHPDVNPGNQQQAKEKFIQLTDAYKFLMSQVPPDRETESSEPPIPAPAAGKVGVTEVPPVASPVEVKVTRKVPRIQRNPALTEAEQLLKQSSYEQLQQLLKYHRFPRAIALVEGLAQRIPKDPEVRQWQAITYQRWGRYLIDQKELDKARIYLKKALRTDPHNRSLWSEIERDFRRMEKIF